MGNIQLLCGGQKKARIPGTKTGEDGVSIRPKKSGPAQAFPFVKKKSRSNGEGKRKKKDGGVSEEYGHACENWGTPNNRKRSQKKRNANSPIFLRD